MSDYPVLNGAGETIISKEQGGTPPLKAGSEVFLSGAFLMHPGAGQYFSFPVTTGLGTIAGVANREVIAPLLCPFDTPVDQVGVSVSTAVAAALVKVTVYEADALGRPGALVYESADIDAGTVGTKTVAASFTLKVGKVYWFGVRTSSTATLRAAVAASLAALSYTNAATPVVRNALTRTLTYATPATDWVYDAAQMSNLLPALVLARAA